MPKPGPEHAVLKMDVGTWDAAVEINPGPGMDAMKSKGVEVNTLGCGGLCLITDFKGEMMPGMAFHGHGTVAWDVTKKQYRTSWTDSMSQGLSIGELTWDPKAKKLAGTMEGPDQSGQVMKVRTVSEYQGRRLARDDRLHRGARRQGDADDAHHLHQAQVGTTMTRKPRVRSASAPSTIALRSNPRRWTARNIIRPL